MRVFVHERMFEEFDLQSQDEERRGANLIGSHSTWTCCLPILGVCEQQSCPKATEQDMNVGQG